MNKWKYVLLAALLCGCFSRHTYITHERFDSVQVGDPISVIVDEAGEPYAQRKMKNGEIEYEYIENFSRGTVLIYENHYFFLVKDGKIVNKKMVQKQEDPYDLIYQDDPNHHYYP
ncbi:MAG: hypothetical protein FJZ57_06805 [Chlamydiae bacterium]|nr:hypothetical protein [Chlamydiota bacterium]